MDKTLELNETDYAKLRNLLDNAGEKLRDLGADAGDEDAKKIADGCDHWLQIIECL